LPILEKRIEMAVRKFVENGEGIVFLEKLVVAQMLKKFTVSYEP
jgi:hypothetical protein